MDVLCGCSADFQRDQVMNLSTKIGEMIVELGCDHEWIKRKVLREMARIYVLSYDTEPNCTLSITLMLWMLMIWRVM